MIKYLGPLQILIYRNAGRFQLDEYGENRIIKESILEAKQFDNSKPSWINTIIQRNRLSDEVGLVQWGVEDEIEYTKVEFDAPAPSSMWDWPTEIDPDNKYKIVSSYVTLTMDQKVIER